jgi:deoxyribose-phosphate aldolase
MRDRADLARRVLATMDLTSLGEDDGPDVARALCAAARTRHGSPAAICVHPELVATAREALDALDLEHVAVASVANFPDGGSDADRAVREVRRALAAGADEVDVVFPYRALMVGDGAIGATLLARCRALRDGRYRLKAILETGVLADPALIARASAIAIEAGADFIKTSTGKVAVNATPEAAATMLRAIREHGGQCGFKAAGGIRTLDDAAVYLGLADDILGPDWASPERFRIGASRLLAEIQSVLDAGPCGPRSGSGEMA